MPKVKTDTTASDEKPETKKKRARKAETGKRVVPDVSVRGPWSEGERELSSGRPAAADEAASDRAPAQSYAHSAQSCTSRAS